VYFAGDTGTIGLYRVGAGGVVAQVGGAITPRHLTSLGDSVFFFAEATNSLDFEPFVATAGVVASLGTINPDGSADPRNDPDSDGFALAGDKIVFAATTSATLDEPWVTDGTAPGTHLLKDLVTGPTGSSPRGFVALGSRALFKASADGSGARNWDAFWASDGTAAGTIKLTPDGLTVVYY
jgi:ELWxxDGT repeat protein